MARLTALFEELGLDEDALDEAVHECALSLRDLCKLETYVTKVQHLLH